MERGDASFGVLLDQVQAGESQAWSLLYERYAPPVIGLLRRRSRQIIRRRCDTMDLAQSVFAEVLRDLPRFENRGERAFQHWLYIKAESKLRGKQRKFLDRSGQPRERELVDDRQPSCGSASPLHDLVAREEVATVRGLLRRLSPGDRRFVALRLDEGLSFAEIAERLDLPSADAARKRYARCLLRLKRQWTRTSKTS